MADRFKHLVAPTPQGGGVFLDSTLSIIWQKACELQEADLYSQLLKEGFTPEAVKAALICLKQAGLLGEQKNQEVIKKPGPVEGALVSTVIVAYNSLEWLADCLTSIAEQTYQPIEVILVDNGSRHDQDPATYLKAHFPQVRLIRLEHTQSLADAINRGIEAARGEYFLVLNPDVRLEPEAAARMVTVASAEQYCAAVAPKLRFSWAPAFLNGIGNRVGAFSFGLDNGLGHLDLGQFDDWKEVPSACFAAVLIPRRAWQEVGALDEGFPMYYEDSEWCYRARMLGKKVLAAPQAVIDHAFGGRAHTGYDVDLTPKKLGNAVYGRLRFTAKLLTPRQQLRFFASYALDDLARIGLAITRLDGRSVEAILGGWKRLTETRREIDLQRKTIQARRKISDRDLFCLQRDLPQVHIRHGLPELTWDLVQNHYKPLLMTAVDHTNQDPLRISLFIISNDTLDAHMAGPGLRYLEIARALSRDLDVSLACPGETSLQVPGVRLISYKIEEPNPLIRQAQASQIVLLSPLTLNKFPALIDLSAWLIIDLYDPFLFENLHYYLKEPVGIQEDLNRQSVDVLNRAISAGDFFLCGSERQRDLWMGFLAANGRISPSALQKDPSLRSLIDVVGIGFLDREPQGHPFLRGLHPAFSVESKIVLWGGGMWDWLDPLTLVQAWPEVLAQIPEARLVFLGRRHPNPLVPRHAVAAQTEELAERLGEKDRSIFFYDWLAYADREALLCEADVGVTLHPLHVETRYSIRTRVMDYFWARLPVLITEGDVTSGWVQEWGLGRVVPEKDPQAVAQALLDILSIPKQDWASCFTPLRERFAWPRVVDPLQRYCLENRHLPDRLAERRSRASQKRSSNWRISLARAHYLWRTEGPGSTFHRAWRYIQWRLSR